MRDYVKNILTGLGAMLVCVTVSGLVYACVWYFGENKLFVPMAIVVVPIILLAAWFVGSLIRLPR